MCDNTVLYVLSELLNIPFYDTYLLVFSAANPPPTIISMGSEPRAPRPPAPPIPRPTRRIPLRVSLECTVCFMMYVMYVTYVCWAYTKCVILLILMSYFNVAFGASDSTTPSHAAADDPFGDF
jgi:hypothetical protein